MTPALICITLGHPESFLQFSIRDIEIVTGNPLIDFLNVPLTRLGHLTHEPDSNKDTEKKSDPLDSLLELKVELASPEACGYLGDRIG